MLREVFLGTDISVCNVVHRDGFHTAHARNRRDSYSAYPAQALIWMTLAFLNLDHFVSAIHGQGCVDFGMWVGFPVSQLPFFWNLGIPVLSLP